MKYALRLSALLIIAFAGTHCKKEAEEKDSDHFMAHLELRSAGNKVELSSNYSNNEKNVIIGTDSIYFSSGGLFHFEGKLSVNVIPQNTAFPSFYELYMIVGPMFLEYTLCGGTTEYYNASGSAANASFEMDLYIQPNTILRLRKRLSNMVLTPGSALISGYFSGYRKGN